MISIAELQKLLTAYGFADYVFCSHSYHRSPICRMVTDQLDEESEPNQLGKLKIFAGVREYPVRVKCATLSWHTLVAALKDQGKVSTE